MENIEISKKLAIQCYSLLGSIDFESILLEEKRKDSIEQLEKTIKQ